MSPPNYQRASSLVVIDFSICPMHGLPPAGRLSITGHCLHAARNFGQKKKAADPRQFAHLRPTFQREKIRNGHRSGRPSASSDLIRRPRGTSNDIITPGYVMHHIGDWLRPQTPATAPYLCI
jgi:hypothetical protein